MEGLLTVNQVAERLGVCPDTVYLWLTTGKLVGYKAGRLWRITEEKLHDFLTREQGGGQQAVKQAVKTPPCL